MPFHAQYDVTSCLHLNKHSVRGARCVNSWRIRFSSCWLTRPSLDPLFTRVSAVPPSHMQHICNCSLSQWSFCIISHIQCTRMATESWPLLKRTASYSAQLYFSDPKTTGWAYCHHQRPISMVLPLRVRHVIIFHHHRYNERPTLHHLQPIRRRSAEYCSIWSRWVIDSLSSDQ